jgi:hypothetical protein
METGATNARRFTNERGEEKRRSVRLPGGEMIPANGQFAKRWHEFVRLSPSSTQTECRSMEQAFYCGAAVALEIVTRRIAEEGLYATALGQRTSSCQIIDTLLLEIKEFITAASSGVYDFREGK